MRTLHALIVFTLAAGSAQAAALKDQPPDGVKLSGLWQIDPRLSDDPVEVIQKAEKAEIAQRRRQIEERNRDISGRTWGDERDGPWDASLPGDPHGRRDPMPGRGDRDIIIDPAGGETSVSWSTARPRSASDEFLLQLDPNPETLTILDRGSRVSVSEDKLETACNAGEVAPIADAFGDGDRKCGWRGRAWVIETTRIERFKRIDRFELSRDGQQLVYTSTATGSRIPTIKVSRTYTLAASGSSQR